MAKLALNELLDSSVNKYRKRDLLKDFFLNPDNDSRKDFKTLLTESSDELKKDILSQVQRYKVYTFTDDIGEWLITEDESLKRDVLTYLEKHGTAEWTEKVEELCTHSSFSISYAAKKALKALQELEPTSVTITEVDPPTTAESAIHADESSKVSEEQKETNEEKEEDTPSTEDSLIKSTITENPNDETTNKVDDVKQEYLEALKTDDLRLLDSSILQNDFKDHADDYLCESQEVFVDETLWQKASRFKLLFPKNLKAIQKLYHDLYRARP